MHCARTTAPPPARLPALPCRHVASQVCTQWELAAARTHTILTLDLPLRHGGLNGPLTAAIDRRRPRLTHLDLTVASGDDLPGAGLLACTLPRLQTLFVDTNRREEEEHPSCAAGSHLPWPEVGLAPPLPLPPLCWSAHTLVFWQAGNQAPAYRNRLRQCHPALLQWLTYLRGSLRYVALGGLALLPPAIGSCYALTKLILHDTVGHGFGLPATFTLLTQLQVGARAATLLRSCWKCAGCLEAWGHAAAAADRPRHPSVPPPHAGSVHSQQHLYVHPVGGGGV